MALEAVWIALNLTTLALTLSALVDALADQTAVRLLNGHAREMAAGATVRRESFRVAVQGLLLVAVIPAVFDLDPQLTIAALMAVPVVLVVSSILDARDRRRSTILVAADIIAERVSAMARLEDAVAENTHLTVLAGQHADHAYREANSVNEKIATQGEAIISQGEAQAQASESSKRVEATVDETAAQVQDIHDATVKS